MWGEARLVNVNWNPDDGQLNVNANDLENQNPNLGARPSRRSRPYFLHIVSIPVSFCLFPVVYTQFQDILYSLSLRSLSTS